MAENLTYEIINSDDGGITCELPLSATQTDQPTVGIIRDSFASKRSHWELWRTGSSGTAKELGSGIVTSVNLNKDRDTILMSGRDWIWYLKQRIYPFNPEDYVIFNPDVPEQHALDSNGDGTGDSNWPKRWPNADGDAAVDLRDITRDLIRSMRTGRAIDINGPNVSALAPGVPDISFNAALTGATTKYKIFPGDSTKIYDHVKTLSERNDGFEFDIDPISLEFKMWSPRRDNSSGFPEYIIKVADLAEFDPNIPAEQQILEGYGQIIEFDWTNDGPDGTYLLGLGTRAHRVGRVWTDIDNVNEFGRLDLVYDYGELSNTDNILQKLKDQNDLHPQKKLGITFLNPEFLVPSMYTGGRPRSLMGAMIFVLHDFVPYHKVNAYFRINQIGWVVDSSSNEQVTWGLEMIYEPTLPGS